MTADSGVNAVKKLNIINKLDITLLDIIQAMGECIVDILIEIFV